MNDAERAEWLARAIDRLVHGAGQDQTPDEIGDQELDTLLGVAELRHTAGNERRRSSAEHESAVWGKLARVLNTAAISTSPDHAEEMVEAIASRRPLYRDTPDDAESEVWERVRLRLAEDRMYGGDEEPRAALERAASGRATLSRASNRTQQVHERVRARMRSDPRHTSIEDIVAVEGETSLFARLRRLFWPRKTHRRR
jgi:hypothetical protein